MIKYFIEGIVIGIGKIVPGVSGALFAMIFGVYEDIIECLDKPKLLIKKRSMMIPLMFGIITSIIFTSGILKYLLDYYYVYVMSVFILILLYSMISMIKDIDINKRYVIVSILIVFVISGISICNVDSAYTGGVRGEISLFLSGIIDAISSIVPGISGSSILMLVGTYDTILLGLSTLNISILIPFLLGFILGVMIISKIVNYLYKTYPKLMKLLVFTLLVYSIINLSYITINCLNI